MNETSTPKEKAQALRRARTVQPGESQEVKDRQKIIEENCRHEDELYTQRGYGGYIHSEQIEAIRETTFEAVQEIEELRKAQD